MIDVADQAVRAQPLRLEQLLQQGLALAQRLLAEVGVTEIQQVEREQHEIVHVAFRERGLQRREVRRAVRIERGDFAVDDAVGKFRCERGDRLELVGPVQALARLQRRFVASDAQLHAIAVELRFVRPLVAARRLLHELAQLGLDEVRHLTIHVASARASLRESSMKGFGARPLPAAMSLIGRPEATEASSSIIFCVAAASRANSSRCLISSQFVRLPP